MPETLKIAIPMAGLGTRMRPHTWSKPKPLMAVAGRTVLDYVLDQFKSLPDPENAEYVFIIGPGPQNDQLKKFMEEKHPEKKVHYVIQHEMRGQSDALWQARKYLKGPLLMTFSDTLIETDLAFVQEKVVDGVACVKEVPDPRRFGVAVVDPQGGITRLIEKPQDLSNNLVVVGFYFFRDSEQLLYAIDQQMRRKITLKNEYFLTDAVNILLEGGAKFRIERIETWLDAGTPETLLETNRYLMDKGNENSILASRRTGVTVIPPVFIHHSAQIESSVIGPYVSIDKDCRMKNVIIHNSIIGEGSIIHQMMLQDSLIGQEVHLEGQAMRFNLGDNSWTM